MPRHPPVKPLVNDIFNDVSGDYPVQPGFGQSIVGTTRPVVLSHVDSESKSVKGKNAKSKPEPNSSGPSNSKLKPNSSRPSTQPNSSRPSTVSGISPRSLGRLSRVDGRLRALGGSDGCRFGLEAAQQKFVDLVPGDIAVEPGLDRSFIRAGAGAVRLEEEFVDLVPGDIAVQPGLDRSFIRAGAGAVRLTNSSSSSVRKISGSRR